MSDPKMSAAELEYEKVRMETLKEFPDFRVVPKDESKLMAVIAVILRIISFGGMQDFMSGYTTTIGATVYVSSRWSSLDWWSMATTLRHERVHMRQKRRLGWIAFAMTYLFLPLPLVFAAGRRNLEQEAYEETIRAYVEYFGARVARLDTVREHILSQFLGPNYLWMWPFRESLERWYDDFLYELTKPAEGTDGKERQRLQG